MLPPFLVLASITKMTDREYELKLQVINICITYFPVSENLPIFDVVHLGMNN
jgi:hypothetical protein